MADIQLKIEKPSLEHQLEEINKKLDILLNADQPTFTDDEPIKLQLFKGKPYRFTIWSKWPLINVDDHGNVIEHGGEDLIKIEKDKIEIKQVLKRGMVLK